MKDNEVLTHVVGNVKIARVLIHRQGSRPIQARFRTLNDPQGRFIAVGLQAVNRDGGRPEPARTGNGIVGNVSPVIYEQELAPRVDRHAMGI